MKKMEKTIEVRDDLANYVESLQYEVNSMMAIMSFMLDRDMDTSTEAFQNWNRKYTEAYASYEAAKAELERDYIKSDPELNGKAVKWNFDFETKTLTITEK
jgi:hypothetical protein